MSAPGRSAFTLVEMLVATAVLTLLVVLLSGAIQLILDTWSAGSSRADNYTRARAGLSLMDRELRNIWLEENLIAFDTVGEPAFFTRKSGLRGSRELAFVRYRVVGIEEAGPTDRPGLWRDALLLDFSDPSPIGALRSEFPVDAADFHSSENVSPGVLGMVVEFLRADGSVSPNFVRPGQSGATPLLRVNFLVADDRTVQLLDGANLADFTALIATVDAGSSASVAEQWTQARDAAIADGTLPAVMGNGMRVFSRVLAMPQTKGEL